MSIAFVAVIAIVVLGLGYFIYGGFIARQYALDDRRTTGTTDARFFGLYAGLPALVYGPQSDDVHGFDERVNVESIRKITQATALFISEWCGLQKV